MDTKITRRSAAGLLLAGLAIPTTKTLAAERVVVRIRLNAQPTLAALTDCDGETITAEFSSDLHIGSYGGARGFMRFAIGDRTIDYAAERGSLDLDDAGAPIRAWILMQTRGGHGLVAQDYLFGTIIPDPATADCLIYDIVGPIVHDTPVGFDVPGRFEILEG